MMGEIMLTSLEFSFIIVIPLKFDAISVYHQKKLNGTTSVTKDENETKCVRDRVPCILRPLRNHF